MLLGDGDGFVKCACGHSHWGLYGAAGLLVFDPERGVLLQRRAWWTHHGGTWALPGGAVRSDETPEQAAIREAAEEADIPAELVRPVASSTDEHGTWRYTTVLAGSAGPLHARAVSAETAELRWVAAHEVAALPLHDGFAAAWPALRARLRDVAPRGATSRSDLGAAVRVGTFRGALADAQQEQGDRGDQGEHAQRHAHLFGEPEQRRRDE